MIRLPRLSLGWCTSDWGGGINYGPYALRRACKIVAETKNLGAFDRQALTLSILASSPHQIASTFEITIHVSKRRITTYFHSARDLRAKIARQAAA